MLVFKKNELRAEIITLVLPVSQNEQRKFLRTFDVDSQQRQDDEENAEDGAVPTPANPNVTPSRSRRQLLTPPPSQLQRPKSRRLQRLQPSVTPDKNSGSDRNMDVSPDEDDNMDIDMVVQRDRTSESESPARRRHLDGRFARHQPQSDGRQTRSPSLSSATSNRALHRSYKDVKGKSIQRSPFSPTPSTRRNQELYWQGELAFPVLSSRGFDDADDSTYMDSDERRSDWPESTETEVKGVFDEGSGSEDYLDDEEDDDGELADEEEGSWHSNDEAGGSGDLYDEEDENEELVDEEDGSWHSVDEARVSGDLDDMDADIEDQEFQFTQPSVGLSEASQGSQSSSPLKSTQRRLPLKESDPAEEGEDEGEDAFTMLTHKQPTSVVVAHSTSNVRKRPAPLSRGTSPRSSPSPATKRARTRRAQDSGPRNSNPSHSAPLRQRAGVSARQELSRSPGSNVSKSPIHSDSDDSIEIISVPTVPRRQNAHSSRVTHHGHQAASSSTASHHSGYPSAMPSPDSRHRQDSSARRPRNFLVKGAPEDPTNISTDSSDMEEESSSVAVRRSSSEMSSTDDPLLLKPSSADNARLLYCR